MKFWKKNNLNNQFSQHVELVQKKGQYYSRSVKNGYLKYCGNQVRFLERLSLLTENQKQEVFQCSITITGQKIREEHQCCYRITLILGFLFIIPFFCMCFSWWQNQVYPAFKVQLSVYQKLKDFIQSSSIDSLELIVYDNTFNQQKSQILKQMLKKSKIRTFNFYNKALSLDYAEAEKSKFKSNMKEIKDFMLETSHLQWNQVIV